MLIKRKTKETQPLKFKAWEPKMIAVKNAEEAFDESDVIDNVTGEEMYEDRSLPHDYSGDSEDDL